MVSFSAFIATFSPVFIAHFQSRFKTNHPAQDPTVISPSSQRDFPVLYASPENNSITLFQNHSAIFFSHSQEKIS